MVPPVEGEFRAAEPDEIPHEALFLVGNVWLSRLALSAFGLLVLRWGWVSDDGFIAARTWRNFVHGEGLVLNLGERVQAFTSPLHTWIGIVVYALTKQPFSALVVTSLLAIVLLGRFVFKQFSGERYRSALFFLVLSLSPSVLSFATAGLENAWGYLLITAFAFAALRDGVEARGARVWTLAALCVLCRQDYALLCAPVLAVSLFKDPRRALRDARLGIILLILWFGFSLFYFGFVFPNTAYAKLNVVIPRGVLLAHGVAYVIDAVHRDPGLCLGLCLGGFFVWVGGARSLERRLLAGAFLYIAYVIWIGGDFMSGRFFTVPFVLMTATLCSRPELNPRWGFRLSLGLLAWVLIGLGPREPNRMDTHCSGSANGITDERACYAEHTSLVENLTEEKWRTHGYLKGYADAAAAEPSNVVVFHLVGMAGFAPGPRKHILETWALSEPLLARLTYRATHYRPGHYPRDVPAGYAESLRAGKNLVVDPCVHRLYDRLRLATRSPLLAAGRLRAIFELNFVERTCPAPS